MQRLKILMHGIVSQVTVKGFLKNIKRTSYCIKQLRMHSTNMMESFHQSTLSMGSLTKCLLKRGKPIQSIGRSEKTCSYTRLQNMTSTRYLESHLHLRRKELRNIHVNLSGIIMT